MKSLWPRSVDSPEPPRLAPLLEVQTDVVLPRLAESEADGRMVVVLVVLAPDAPEAGGGHRPPERVPDERPPELLLSEKVVVPAVYRVYLHVDVAQRTDWSEVAGPQVPHLQLTHRVERTSLQLVN